jgi:GxxExxY protein
MENVGKADKYFPHKELSYKLVGAIYNVANTYGSGQKELVYQNALAEELESLKIPFKREVSIPIESAKTGKVLGRYQLDFVIDEKIIVEVKEVKFTPSKLEQQLYSYLRSTQCQVGYLVNFGSTKLYLKRVILTN